MKSSTGLALHFMRKGLPRRSWACPATLRGVLKGEGAAATTAPKCTKVLQTGAETQAFGAFSHRPSPSLQVNPERRSPLSGPSPTPNGWGCGRRGPKVAPNSRLPILSYARGFCKEVERIVTLLSHEGPSSSDCAHHMLLSAVPGLRAAFGPPRAGAAPPARDDASHTHTTTLQRSVNHTCISNRTHKISPH